jgi:flagellar biosynthesis/type III secretory pathway protein FliH
MPSGSTWPGAGRGKRVPEIPYSKATGSRLRGTRVEAALQRNLNKAKLNAAQNRSHPMPTDPTPTERDLELAEELWPYWADEEHRESGTRKLAQARSEGRAQGRREGLEEAVAEVDHVLGQARAMHQEDSPVIFRLRQAYRRVRRLLDHKPPAPAGKETERSS